jgi:hypothetical protein
MKRVFGLTARLAAGVAVGVTICCGMSYAAGPSLGLDAAGLGRHAARDPGIHLQAAAFAPGTLQAFAPRREPATPEEVIGRLAYKISYVGSVLLTADRIVRSVDSVLDSMEWTGADGTCLRIAAEPATHGFEVGVRVSRPINF